MLRCRSCVLPLYSLNRRRPRTMRRKAVEDSKMRVAIYARYSSELQDARSIDDQIALARLRAGREGWKVVAVFADRAISGASIANRPALRELMQAAEARQFDVVLTESLDRLSRDIADSAALHRQLAFWDIKIITL